MAIKKLVEVWDGTNLIENNISFLKKTTNEVHLPLSNNIKIALKLSLDCVYIPSFNKLCNFKNLNSKKNFKIIGSAHNIFELKNKENQGCISIFITPLFKTKKSNYFLDIFTCSLIFFD